ncbi:hypothetical protein LTR36_010688 [Oleoguttula mirabilis]|uniref:Glycoside hydrolase family 5 domain-containing protein n=1 Tax=Oleoguttula mirabilis TaxID=1507867 RepID=A0AAV9JQU0_9PEZI|nr:hypothetical protein LTR36_010688 [Oleoguttula mirabilis]
MRRPYAAAALLLSLITAAATQALDVHSLASRAASTPDVVRGVNLGGWLVSEEWITPSLYQSTGASDEWHLCNTLGNKKCSSKLKTHWKTFYTRDDFVDIKAAGLNAVRIPVGYWAVDRRVWEPYVNGQYPYLIRAVQWAKELGLSVLIDLHGAPGSQNGQDNSGLIGPVLFPSNSSNAARSLYVLNNLTQEFSNAIYGGAVTGIELLNEPRLGDNSTDDFSMDELKDFYTDATKGVRAANDADTINVTIHDAFYGPQYWADYDALQTTSSAPADLLTLDTHQYYAFNDLANLPHTQILASVCNISQLLKQPVSTSGIPYTLVGEFSLETGSAPTTTSSDQNNEDDQARRTWFRLLFEAQIAAYSPNGPGQSSIGWFFWTWKTEYEIDTWSYRRGVAHQYIPADVSNASDLVYTVLENGCIDLSADGLDNYTAPASVAAASGRIGGGGSGLLAGLLPVVVGLMSLGWVF